MEKKMTGLIRWFTAFLTLGSAWALPRPDHVVVVMEENHSYNEIIGSSSAPYINNTLVPSGALMTHSFAISHPSEPNYCAIFSGSTQGLTSDACPVDFGNTPNEGNSLLLAGLSFIGYSETLPSAGSTVCTAGSSGYARKHSPWVNWQVNGNIPAADNQPFTAFPPGPDYSSLPTVSWVIPNLADDMHDGTIQQGDSWLQSNINGYMTWCQTHNSLLIVTWDEDDSTQNNQIPTIFIGQGVCKGQFSEQVNHYNVLRTMMDMYGLAPINNTTTVSPITDIFACGGPTTTPTATATHSFTFTATLTATNTSTPLATATPTVTHTPVPPTATATPTFTNTPAPPTNTPTATNSPLPTNTPTLTHTPAPPTATFTFTNTPTVTDTPLPTTPTPTATPKHHHKP